MRHPELATIRDACAQPYGFWLDSAMVDGRLGRRSFWGAEPEVILRAADRCVEIERTRGATERYEGDPFDALRELLAEWRGRPEGGAAGYLGYGLKRHVERLPDTVAHDLALPECQVAFYDRLRSCEPGALAPQPPAPGLPLRFDGLQSSLTRERYEALVRRALEYIAAGDCYQVNLSQRFQAPCPGDPFDAYLGLRAHSPAPFAAFLRYPGYAVLSSSPERFLRYDATTRSIETRPIKGTRPRSADGSEDAALACELRASEKDRAENLMIVDLERNDLGRVAEVGSVEVGGLFELETYATVHHLTSTVRARLAEDRDAVDLLRATFPGGSITGAPKIRAMEIIDELEPVARDVYTGAIGYFGGDGSLELNVAIRTAVVKDGQAYFHVGGGIVADSDPALEYEEGLHKGAAMAHVFVGEGESAA